LLVSVPPDELVMVRDWLVDAENESTAVAYRSAVVDQPADAEDPFALIQTPQKA
jgi:hypothetical protein